jgi:hypothetical protein
LTLSYSQFYDFMIYYLYGIFLSVLVFCSQSFLHAVYGREQLRVENWPHEFPVLTPVRGSHSLSEIRSRSANVTTIYQVSWEVGIPSIKIIVAIHAIM